MAQTVNWFPGHMARTLRTIGERLRQVDVVIEICDARIPKSSRNPELDRLIGDKPRILLLGKEDLADPSATAEWISYYRHVGLTAIACDSTKRPGAERIRKACLELCADRISRAKERGRIYRPARAMVVGIPNTGKSTLINTLAGRSAAKTEDRPGITRAPQWVRTAEGLELMDMPGVLWADLGSRDRQLHLAATGAIKDDVIDVGEIASETLGILILLYPKFVRERYKAEDLEQPMPDLLDDLARRRGCVLSGGRIDQARFATLLLDELRAGRIGRISLERPESKVRS